MCVQDVNAVVTEFCLIPTNNMQKKKKNRQHKICINHIQKIINSKSISFIPPLLKQ